MAPAFGSRRPGKSASTWRRFRPSASRPRTNSFCAGLILRSRVSTSWNSPRLSESWMALWNGKPWSRRRYARPSHLFLIASWKSVTGGPAFTPFVSTCVLPTATSAPPRVVSAPPWAPAGSGRQLRRRTRPSAGPMLCTAGLQLLPAKTDGLSTTIRAVAFSTFFLAVRVPAAMSRLNVSWSCGSSLNGSWEPVAEPSAYTPPERARMPITRGFLLCEPRRSGEGGSAARPKIKSALPCRSWKVHSARQPSDISRSTVAHVSLGRLATPPWSTDMPGEILKRCSPGSTCPGMLPTGVSLGCTCRIGAFTSPALWLRSVMAYSWCAAARAVPSTSFPWTSRACRDTPRLARYREEMVAPRLAAYSSGVAPNSSARSTSTPSAAQRLVTVSTGSADEASQGFPSFTNA
mmetsp:Transcript_33424/g.104170  ORF Transcript_33424/g.104170 Transcript_33424/m.104170 type:complete len:406 (-) Transcript_33424:1855-3072(-)